MEGFVQEDGGTIVMKRIGALVVSVVLGLSLVTVVPGCNSTTYTPPALTPQVSTPVIGQDGVLRVGVDANNSPFAGKPADTIIGLNVDMAAALADELGLKLQVVDIGANPDKALADGTVDIVVGVDSSDTTITCWQSEAYIQSGVALFAMSSASAVPALDSNPTIAAQSSSMSAWEVNKQYGETALQSSPELKTAFSDLQSGSVSFVAADAVIGTYAAYSNSPRINATMIALMEKPAGYTIGVLDSNSDLKQLISD
ncbi:MAG: transporter substrate-binding domain-containing protein, partial [Eggerthellaceae bacterium]|nr:transporter substrate-binding domain-containing protein [Eggerthellaceae bacterium]